MPEGAPVPGNVVYVGRKPALVYAVAALTRLTENPAGVILKARGQSISRAVDAQQILQRRFLGNQVQVKEIKIGTETMPPREGEGLRERNVSTIEITIVKTG